MLRRRESTRQKWPRQQAAEFPAALATATKLAPPGVSLPYVRDLRIPQASFLQGAQGMWGGQMVTPAARRNYRLSFDTGERGGETTEDKRIGNRVNRENRIAEILGRGSYAVTGSGGIHLF